MLSLTFLVEVTRVESNDFGDLIVNDSVAISISTQNKRLSHFYFQIQRHVFQSLVNFFDR